MAITLEAIPAPGATPIGNNTASAQAFANDYYKLAVPNISSQDRKAILALALLKVLAQSGANYTSNHNALIQDACVYTKGISQIDLITGLTAECWESARFNATGISDDVPTLLQEARDLADLPEITLDRIFLFLVAQLGF